MICSIIATQCINAMEPENKDPNPVFPKDISRKIFFDHFVDSCNSFAGFLDSKDSKHIPKQIHDHICNTGLINTALCNFVHSPETTRNIVDKISNRKNQCFLAVKIQTKAMRNYVKQTTILYRYGFKVDNKRINDLFARGADLNFNSEWECPTLSAIQKNKNVPQKSYNNLQLLLQLGADPNIDSKYNNPLQVALDDENIPIIKLLLSCNPHKKCIYAATNSSIEILKIFIEHGNLTVQELNIGLEGARQINDKEKMSLFIAAGAQPEQYSFIRELQESFRNHTIFDAISDIIFNNFKEHIVTTIIDDGCIIPIVIKPLLFLSIGNAAVTQRLLGLGIDHSIIHRGKTALDKNIEQNNIQNNIDCIIPFLSYISPQYYIRKAFNSRNAATMDLFLDNYTFSQEELKAELQNVVVTENTAAIPLLLKLVSDKQIKLHALGIAIGLLAAQKSRAIEDPTGGGIATIKIMCQYLPFPLEKAMELLDIKTMEFKIERENKKIF